jgi:TrmH family RNA methyltransferase
VIDPSPAGRPSPALLNRLTVVLWETQDLVNIAGTIRAMKNFGLRNLRLVSPLEWDAWRIEGIAHGTGDLIAETRVYATLHEALADCSFTVAMTARERRAKRDVGRPRDTAADLLARAADETGGPIAIVFGREDTGLPNWAMDLCHRTITIPTNPEHSSLNLAQAVLVMAYELWMASEGRSQPFKPPRRDAPPANVQILETLFEETERALWSIDFFKSRQTESVMRTLRSLVHRADLDQREAGFLRAIAVEVQRYIEREVKRQEEEEEERSQ